jgi:Small subunit of serine palmitoyltransferase-like
MTKTATIQQPQQPKQRYYAPKSGLGKFLWRKKMWVESTFALTMLERWEKILVGELLHLELSLMLTFTSHIVFVRVDFIHCRSNVLFASAFEVLDQESSLLSSGK